MNEQTVRKTFKYKLTPTPQQEEELGRVLGLCRWLYNTALEQRIIAYRRTGVSLSRYSQEAELKDLRAAMPEYAAIHSHVLQDVLARLDKTYQAFFRRLKAGEKAGFPRYQGRDRYHSFTYKEFGNGATLDNNFLVLSKIGRIAVRWSRPIQGTLKTVTISREADRMVRLLLLRRRAHPAVASDWT
jgi:putative transposase